MDIDPKVLAAIFAALYAASEAIGLSKKLKENSTIEMIWTFVSKILGKDGK